MRTLIALAIAIGAFIGAPMFIVVPMSFSDSQSFAFPPTGYWLGYYKAYFSDETWTTPTINSTIIATATMFVTMALVIPASFSMRPTGRSTETMNALDGGACSSSCVPLIGTNGAMKG